jgi:hypothetical protein
MLKNKEYTEGGLDYEKHRPERHWWVQAEAMVGFLNAYELSHEAHFFRQIRCLLGFYKTLFY